MSFTEKRLTSVIWHPFLQLGIILGLRWKTVRPRNYSGSQWNFGGFLAKRAQKHWLWISNIKVKIGKSINVVSWVFVFYTFGN